MSRLGQAHLAGPVERFPWDPLGRILEPMTGEAVAELAGVAVRSVRRWQRHGLPAAAADHIAVTAAGVHPAEVWPDLWQAGA